MLAFQSFFWYDLGKLWLGANTKPFLLITALFGWFFYGIFMSKKLIVFTDEQVNQVEKLATLHLTAKQIADFMGINRDTFFAIMERQEQVRAAFNKGQASLITLASQTLAQKIKDGDLTATIFFLKTKAGWKETLDLSNEDGTLSKPTTIKLIAGKKKKDNDNA